MKSTIPSLRLAFGCVGVMLACGAWAAPADKPDNAASNKVMRSGLVAHYFRDPDHWNGAWPRQDSSPNVSPAGFTFSTYAYSRVEPLINHHFINEGWFSVRWVGYVDFSATAKNKGTNGVAEVAFKIWADDGCRLYVDGVKLIDSWVACWEMSPESWRLSPTVSLTDGPHRIVVEYFQGQSLTAGDTDPIKLHWICPGRDVPKEQIIPAAYFSHTDDDMKNTSGK
jgi:hypothetical protein